MPLPWAGGRMACILSIFGLVALNLSASASAFLHPLGAAPAHTSHRAAISPLQTTAPSLCLALRTSSRGAAAAALGPRGSRLGVKEWSKTTRVTMTAGGEIADTPVKGRTVFVAGATGRVGSAVVRQLLARSTTWKVVAGVRNEQRAEEQLGNMTRQYGDRLNVVKVNLEKKKQVREVMEGVDQVIWCASGFSGRSQGRLARLWFLLRVIRYVIWNKLRRVLDLRGAARAAKALKARVGGSRLIKIGEGRVVNRPVGVAGGDGEEGELPRVVMLSSAAVTRPSWSEAKRAAYPESYNIPIVKLNPLGLLDVKKDGEQRLRSTDVAYTIVRSCGINATHPNGRISISTGDTAVGRINPGDLAKVLVTMLDMPVCTRKTFEVYAKAYEGFFSRGGTKGDCQKQLEGVVVDNGNAP